VTKEINDEWLKHADEEKQLQAILEWFQARFWDPAEETPHDEGEYIWLNGGPYDGEVEIRDRFSDIVPENVLEEAADKVSWMGDWAPTPMMYENDQDDLLNFQVPDKEFPYNELVDSIKKARKTLTIEAEQSVCDVVKEYAFASIITAIETFLWKTMRYWLDNSNSNVLKNLVEKNQDIREHNFKARELLDKSNILEKYVKGVVDNVVWHRVKTAEALFRQGFGIKIAMRQKLNEDISIRHDIIHRSGQDKEGNKIKITDKMVNSLAKRAEEFAQDVNKKISESPIGKASS
jgi:hypothetical protein